SPPGLPTSWISPPDYLFLYNSPKLPAASEQPLSLKPETTGVNAAATDYVVVSGTVQRDGSGGQIDPVYHVTTSQPQAASQPAGNHCLQFGNSSSVLGQYCFDLDVTPTGKAGLDQQFFAVTAPWPAGTTRLALIRGATTLATLTAAQDPVVTIASP